ncbi:MAG: transcriptional repressor [Tannerella sp.]|jgi:Fur family ferric uptake transcriptional regulator|nr:transcriptional repressor [Tannerella sp.]
MNTNPYDVDKISKIFREYLMEQGLRITTERKTILEHICRVHGHFDVDMLREMLEEDNFHVSKASIYNTIELLMNACLVVRHQFSTQVVQYELKSAAMGHHHVICSYCGAVREIRCDAVARLVKDVKITRFSYEYYSLYIYGMCSKCRFRLMNDKKDKNK